MYQGYWQSKTIRFAIGNLRCHAPSMPLVHLHRRQLQARYPMAPLQSIAQVGLLVQLLWSHWRHAVQWRVIYLARSRKGGASHTVLITDIPGTPQGTIFGRIFDVRLPVL